MAQTFSAAFTVYAAKIIYDAAQLYIFDRYNKMGEIIQSVSCDDLIENGYLNNKRYDAEIKVYTLENGLSAVEYVKLGKAVYPEPAGE